MSLFDLFKLCLIGVAMVLYTIYAVVMTVVMRSIELVRWARPRLRHPRMYWSTKWLRAELVRYGVSSMPRQRGRGEVPVFDGPTPVCAHASVLECREADDRQLFCLDCHAPLLLANQALGYGIAKHAAIDDERLAQVLEKDLDRKRQETLAVYLERLQTRPMMVLTPYRGPRPVVTHVLTLVERTSDDKLGEQLKAPSE